jgi:hypothetical protein
MLGTFGKWCSLLARRETGVDSQIGPALERFGKAVSSASRRVRDRSSGGSTLWEDEGLEHVRASLLVRGEELQQVRHGDHAAKALGVVQHH